MAGKSYERQERGLISTINNDYNLKTIRAGQVEIKDVISAHKVENDQHCLKKEPFSDIELKIKGNISKNISAKGIKAASIAGGGLTGIKILLPDLIYHFLTQAEEYYLNSGFVPGQTGIPDIYGRINKEQQIILLTGSADIGGPIDYIYRGPMLVQAKFEDGALVLNGEFITPLEFAQREDIFIRLRRRRKDQPFVPGTLDRNGFPSIFGPSPTKGDNNRRIVMTEKLPLNPHIIAIN